jgi:hypothetical protein
MPKTSRFEKTVGGLCDAFVDVRCAASGEEARSRRAEVVGYVLAQHGRMPDYLRFAFRIATLGFDLLGVVHGGRSFHRAEPASRWRQIEAWRQGPVSVTRDFVRFYESLVVQCWYAPNGN